jgi:hypothetical protein
VGCSVDWAWFYDSAGGESLAVRLIGPTKNNEWQQFHLYRRVPASGSLFVTAALTGMGTAYFDDVRVEPLVPATGLPPPGPPARPGARAAR